MADSLISSIRYKKPCQQIVKMFHDEYSDDEVDIAVTKIEEPMTLIRN